jgi:hypothetical protein
MLLLLVVFVGLACAATGKVESKRQTAFDRCVSRCVPVQTGDSAYEFCMRRCHTIFGTPEQRDAARRQLHKK